MNKLIQALGIVFISLVLVGFGYFIGVSVNQPSSDQLLAEQKKQSDREATVDDLLNVTYKYGQLYGLCEQKYQQALNGELTEAYQTRGQMTALEEEINVVMSKYETDEN